MGLEWASASQNLVISQEYDNNKKTAISLSNQGLQLYSLLPRIPEKHTKMPQTGFEPVHGYPYNDLNVARLPVPPLGHLL